MDVKQEVAVESCHAITKQDVKSERQQINNSDDGVKEEVNNSGDGV